MSLPGAPYIAYRGDELYVEDCSAHQLIKQFGTPLYVYSRQAMQAALAAYQRALKTQPHLICYSVKANSNLAVLQFFAQAGCGFDIVSGGELERVLAAGATADRIVFSGVGKTRAEMQRALEVGVRCFNVESLAELEALSQVAEALGCRAPVSLRINPEVDARTHPYISTGLKDNKFGIGHEQALAGYLLAASLAGIEVVGIDCHIGSQITEIEPYLDALDRILDLVGVLQEQGIKLQHLDVGGGLGITYTDEVPPPADELIGMLVARLKARGHSHFELWLEPGRSLVGNAGVLLTEVLYLKPAEHKSFCIVDAAMNDMLRPTLYEAVMQIVPCQVAASGEPRTWDIVGPVCESGDWLGRARPLVGLAAGDHLAILSAGAYGMSMASNYNSRCRPAEIMVAGSQARLIRRRDEVTELYQQEFIWCD